MTKKRLPSAPTRRKGAARKIPGADAARTAAERLRASESRFRAIFDAEPECVKTVSIDGRLLEMNPAGLRMIDAEDEAEVVGRQMSELVHPDDRGAYLELHQRAARGETGQLQFRTVGLKGTERWMESQSVPFHAADGTVAAVLSLTHDISERKRIEAALRESEDRYRDLVENSRDLICTHDLEGHLLSVNEAAVRLTGYPRATLLQMDMADLLAPEVRGGFAAYLQSIRATGRASGLMRIRVASGEIRYWEFDNTLRTEGVAVPVVRGMAQDVTEARRAKEALRESEAKYRALIENMADGLLMVDREEVIRFVNLQVCRMLGYSEAELLGQSATRLLFREEDHTLMAARNGRRAAGIAERYEVEVRRRSGEFLWTSFSVAPVLDAGGRFTGSMAIISDITERKRSEAALRLSETQLRSFIEHAPADIAMFDNDMICLAASQRWIDAYGRGRPTPVGISHYEVNPDLPERWKEIHRRGLAGESEARDEDVWIQADGTRQWLRWSMDPWRDPQGAIGGIVLFLEDISARKQAEEAILAEKAFSEAMLESLPGIFYLFDQTGRFLRWNRALETVSEYSAAEIATMHPLSFFIGEDRALVEHNIRKVFEAGAAEVEADLVAKSGGRIPYFLVGTRISWQGELCCIGTGIDVTARKLLEAELQQSQKIEAIGRLAGGVAHDFNNILGVILGYGELVQSELQAADPLRENIDEMVKAAQRAADLTRQLQAFSRKQVLQPRRLDLNLLAADADRLLARLIGEDIQLAVRPGAGLGAVRADPGQIERIILNLALNARDAMPNGGTLTLETANADLDAAYVGKHPIVVPGRYVRLAVSDTGAGMDEETQSRIFEPFFTTKGPAGGTGLGLASVYGIVKQSGGYIWVYSEPGHGTTFKIYLPRVDEPPEALRLAGPPVDLPTGSETVLVAEDNPALREVIRARLSERGYTVLLAADGEEAVALVRERAGAVDLLLTDVIMPRLGGAELARQLAELRPGLRVIFMSGYTDGALLNLGELADNVVLLEKPFTGESLARTIRASLDRPDAAPQDSGSSKGSLVD